MKQTKYTHFKMLLIAALALVMAFALVACNGDKKNNDNSSDEVSETELYSGTGDMWEFITKENLEFIYGFMFTKVYAEPETAALCGLLPMMNYPMKDEPDSGINFFVEVFTLADDIADSDDGAPQFEGYAYRSHEIAVQIAEDTDDPDMEIIVKDNMVLQVKKSSPYIDDIRTDNYNLDNLRGKPMKLLNSLLTDHVINTLYVSVVNGYQNMTEIEYKCGYYENAHSNCGVSEMMGYLSGEGTEEKIEQAMTEFDTIKPKIGVEYTKDSFAEFDMSEGYFHTKLKIKPGFRFESKTEGEANVTDYYYDSEEGMDVIIPDTTPDGKSVTGITLSNSGIITYDYIKSITIPSSINEIGSSVFNSRESMQAVYYCGTEEQWNGINIKSGNDSLVNAKRYYFSEQPNNDGNHWHWNAQHKPEVWAN